MLWIFFFGHSALLIALFVWLDRRQLQRHNNLEDRQTERYNLFAQWSQVFSKMLGDDVHRIQEQIDGIHESVKELRP